MPHDDSLPQTPDAPQAMTTRTASQTHLRPRVGRRPKRDRACHRYTVNLTDAEDARFRQMLSRAGMECFSRYIHHLLMNREVRVVRLDKAAMDFCIRLTHFYRQFQALGNNYNQTVKAVKANFGEKRGRALLFKLEKATFELVLLSRRIIDLAQEFERRCLHGCVPAPDNSGPSPASLPSSSSGSVHADAPAAGAGER